MNFTYQNLKLRQHGDQVGTFQISGKVNGDAVIEIQEVDVPDNASTLAFVEKAKEHIQDQERIMPSQMFLFYRTGNYLFYYDGEMLRLSNDKELQECISDVEEKEVA